MERRDFLKLTGAGVAGTAFLGSTACAGFTPTVEGTKGTLVFSFGPDESGVLPKAMKMFNETNAKGLKVEQRVMPADTGQYFDKVRTEFQSGVAVADVIGADVIWPAQLAANGWIEPLDELFTEEMQSTYIQGPLDTGRYKGSIYAVPWYADAGMLYYRKDLLDKNGINQPPQTWEELFDVADKVKKAEGLPYGYVGQGAEYEGGVCNGCEYIWNAGGDIQDPNDFSKIVVDSPEATNGLQAGQDLVASGTAPVAIATFKELESLTSFLNQDAVFMRNWPFAYGGLADPALGTTFDPKKVYEQVLVTTLPRTDVDKENVACLGGWTFTINSLSSKKEEAWEFIKFMTSKKVREMFTVDASNMPPERQYYEDKKLIKEQPLLEVAKAAIASTKPRPVHPYYSDMSLRMAEEFNEAVKGEVTPESAIETLQRQMGRIAGIQT
jgi:multiple sugar transport system substrate-binding protein